jgi:hypothetical protein
MIAFGICVALMWTLSVFFTWWWWVMVVPFGYFLARGKEVGLSAAVGSGSAGFFWLCASMWMWFMGGADLIAPRVAQAVGAETPLFLLVLAVALATLAGGIAAAAGASIRIAIKDRTLERVQDAA